MIRNAGLRLRIALSLGGMPGVQIFRHVLFLLRRHFGGVRLTRDTPWTKQGARHIVFVRTGLSIVELTAASET